MNNSLKSLFIICAILFMSTLIVGCTSNKISASDYSCLQSDDNYEVYVGNTIYHNCSFYGSACASNTGCSFNNCTELNKYGEYVHSNTYAKRCP